MTLWVFASLPVWVVGGFMAYMAVAIGRGAYRRLGETERDLKAQMRMGLVLSVPVLILAAWMSS